MLQGSATGLARTGAAPPAGGGLDAVFTSTYDGTICALSARTGATLWTARAPAGIDAFPAVTRTMLIVGAGGRTSAKRPRGAIVAYSLP